MSKHRTRKKKRKQLQPRYLLVILTALCIVFAICGRVMVNTSSGPVNYIAGYIFVPMQKGINQIGDRMSGLTVYFQSKKKLQAENTELTARVNELQTQVNQVQSNNHELEKLRKLYELDETYESYDKTAAEIIAKNSGNWFSTFLIDKGTKNGIEEGMNVIADGGLVGIVIDVGPNYAKVRSVIDDSNNVSAMDVSTSDLCVVNGSLQSMNEEQRITFTDMRYKKKSDVANGDMLVTSNVSDRYLKGIPIGYITSVENDPGTLTTSGDLVPIVDFEHLEHVFVILQKKDTKQ